MPPKKRPSKSPARSPARNSNSSEPAANSSSTGARQRSGSRKRTSSSPPSETRVAGSLPSHDILVHVKAVSGDELASIKAAGDWTGAQVMQALAEHKPLLSGHEYKMIFGDVEFTKSQKICELSGETSESETSICELTITAMVQKKDTFQLDVDLALIDAAGARDLNLVKTLLSAGASAKFIHDPPGTWGACDRKSALHVAIQSLPYGDPEPEVVDSWKAVISMLLEANADVNAKRSSSDWRGCGSSSTAFEMILPRAMQDASLMLAFLAAGADPNTTSSREVHSMRSDGGSRHAVIHTATRSGNRQVMRTLLDAKADANSVATERIQNERGYDQDKLETSLHIACKQGDVKGAALLLAHKADVNVERKELLHEYKTEEEMAAELPDMPCASKTGKTKSKKAVSKSMMTDDPREDGYVSPVRCVPLHESALHIAINSRNDALTALLVCAGADTSAEYARGDTRTSPETLCGGDAALLSALGASATSPSPSKPSVDEATMMYKILKLFKEWDTDCDGFIGEDELTTVLSELGMPEAEIPMVFTSVDWDRDGKISYSEFVDWLYSGIAPAAVVGAATEYPFGL